VRLHSHAAICYIVHCLSRTPHESAIRERILVTGSPHQVGPFHVRLMDVNANDVNDYIPCMCKYDTLLQQDSCVIGEDMQFCEDFLRTPCANNLYVSIV